MASSSSPPPPSDDELLETQLIEAGTKLLTPPLALNQLLELLDQLEGFLSKVDQSPSEDMQIALSPTLKSLVANQLFNHSDNDVKAAVASCISEITRITAPEAPYDDDQMKKIFQLIVSTFENLSDQSSRSFTKRTSILDTVAKVRSCVVMLDLECDVLITEMFQFFYKTLRDDHPENVFTSMETIMTLVLEESEDISLDLLSLVLSPMRKSDKEVLPIARKLGETVLKNCCEKVKPYLAEAVKSRSISLVDYNEVVASICEEFGPVEQNGVHAATEHEVDETIADKAPDDEVEVEKKTDPEKDHSQEEIDPSEDGDKSPKSAVINGVTLNVKNDSLAEVDSPEKQDPGIPEVFKTADGPSNPEPNNNTESVNKTEPDISTEPDSLSSKAEVSKSADGPSNPEPNNDTELVKKSESDNNSELDKLSSKKVVDAEIKVAESTQKQGHRKATISIKVRGPSPSPKENVNKETSKPLVDERIKDILSSAKETEKEKDTSDESPAKKGVQEKEKPGLNTETTPSTDDNITKPSEETKDSEANTKKASVYYEPTSISGDDKSTELSKETRDSEAKAQKSLVQKEPISTSNEVKSPILSDSAKKRPAKKGKGVRSKKKQNFNKKSSTVAKSSDETAKPSEETAKSSDETEKPSEETAKPSDETAKPSEETAKPSDEIAKPSEETAKPSDEIAKPSEETTKKVSGKRAPASSSKVDKSKVISETPAKKGVQGKKKGKMNIEDAPSSEDNSAKPSEESKDTKGKTEKVPGKIAADSISDEIMLDASTKESVDTTDTESKSLATKMDDDVEGSDEGEDKNSHSGGERVSERTASADEEDKQVVSSLKTAGKSTKKENPKGNSKRKHTPVADKASINEYGDNLVGSKVKVWWPQDKAYYKGVIDSYDSVKQKHRVLYNDGDEEVLNLKRQKWELITAESEAEDDEAADEPEPESSSELPLSKKMKTTSNSSKKAGKMGISPKKVGGASSSKSKGKKPANTSEDDRKEEGKSKDRTKTAAKSKKEDNKNQTPKTVKSSDVSAKSASRSKKDDSEKLKGSKSKGEDSATPKTSSKSKQATGKSKVETPKAASSANKKRKATNVKSASSDDGNNENSDDSAEVVAAASKGKSSKAQGSGSKSGKKRPRTSRS
ncbi:hypothetical protein ACFE04_008481 [Oxalis oulophora]